ncbi:amiloride-sensitive sodium channel subunit gamma-like [Ptychodera flava]|uniref:amiloride-sensitive sodium channel subunit gamma-like n=1 Tax=Ptychodera flava TaxID=63121 RepID=UPI00396A4EA3
MSSSEFAWDGKKICEHETAKNTLSVIFDELLKNSSSHGLPNIQRSVSAVGKLSWALLFFVAVIMLLIQTVGLLQTYFSYPVAVSLTMEFDKKLFFPAVTVCNANPVRMSELRAASDYRLRSQFDPSFSPSVKVEVEEVTDSGKPLITEGGSNTTPVGKLKFSRTTDVETTLAQPTTTENSSEPIMSWDDRVGGDFYRKPSNGFSKANSLSVLMANQSTQTKMTMGHQLSTMLLDCVWRGYQCSPDNFTQFYNYKYGNCFTFNSGRNGEALTINKPGPMYGLSLELYIEQIEYMIGTTEAAGVRVLLHHQDEMPFPEDEGFSVAPGQAASVGVRQMELLRKSAPYGDCKDMENLSQEEIDNNIFMSRFDVGYSVQVCGRNCYQYEVIEECGCFDSNYPIPVSAEGRYDACDIVSDEKDMSCVDEVESLYDDDELPCDCPKACREKMYIPSVSSMMWPADKYQATLFAKMAEANTEMKKQMRRATKLGWTRDNVLKLEIYFEELNYEYIREYPSYGRTDLVSDIGGQLGLWIGVSIITLFEIVHFIGVAISICCSKVTTKMNRRGRPSTPVKPFKCVL